MSEVLDILKRRIYFGKAQDTKFSDLKLAEKEILDWADKLLEEQDKRLNPRAAKLGDKVFVADGVNPLVTAPTNDTESMGGGAE